EHNFPRGEIFPLWTHVQMLSDRARVRAIKAALEERADPRANFLEIGCGTGVFSIHAVGRYARVVAVEQDLTLLEIARSNARLAGVVDDISFLHLDARSLTQRMLGHDPDVVLCELLSTGLASEPLIEIINCLHRQFPDSRPSLIPASISH